MLFIIQCLFIILLFTLGADAQTPSSEVRLTVGWTGFLDEGTDNHALAGGSLRYYLTRRVSVEPELVYLSGLNHHDITFVPNIAFDFVTNNRRVVPYVIGGLGVIHSQFSRFETNDVFFEAGGGVKLFLTNRIYFAPEGRAGWEPHLRLTGTFGFVF